METKKEIKVLIILKKRQDSQGEALRGLSVSTGLFNSASYVNQMLLNNNIESNVITVTDNNDIDREVTKYKPTHVIIEALWVVPEKFDVLHKLHPHVKWIIRLHSQIPFLANEGIALEWISKYITKKNVYVACNAKEAFKDIKFISNNQLGTNDLNKIIYLPNYYPAKNSLKVLDRKKEFIDIACFGAIRPMKNHLIQAIAAVKFADLMGKKLRFHINSGRIEKGDNVLKNIKAMFDELSEDYQLIEHKWLDTEDFLKLCSEMDLGLQVSFSETFNIVAADLISSGVAVVGSKEIPWLNRLYTVKPTNTNSIVNGMCRSFTFYKYNVKSNVKKLRKYSKKSEKVWLKYFKHEMYDDTNKILLNR